MLKYILLSLSNPRDQWCSHQLHPKQNWHGVHCWILSDQSTNAMVNHVDVSIVETDDLILLSSSVWRWSLYAEVSFQWHPEAARATNTQQVWRQEFLGTRSSTVERSSTRTAVAGIFLRFLPTIFENTSLWRLKRLVSLSTYRRYINKCIYLSIFLLCYWVHRFQS